MSGRKSKVDPQEIESARRKCDVLQKNLAQCVGQVNKFNTTLRRSQLTLEELANLPASAHTYKTIGRTFIMAPMNEIIEDLQLTIAECKKSAEAGIKQKEYLEQQLKDAVSHFKELLNSQ